MNEEELIRLIFRFLWTMLIFGCAILLRKIVNLLDNKIVSSIFGFFFRCLGVYGGMMLIAWIFDVYFGFKVFIISPIVNFICWSFPFVYLSYLYLNLKNQPKEIQNTDGDEIPNPKYLSKEMITFHAEELIKALQLQDSIITKIKRDMKMRFLR